MPTKNKKLVVEKPKEKHRWHPSRYFTVFSLILLVLVVVVVGTLKLLGFTALMSGSESSSSAAPSVSVDSTGAAELGSAKTAEYSASTAGPQVIQTGSFSITVSNIDSAVADLEALAKKQKGSVDSSQVLHNGQDCTVTSSYDLMMLPERAIAPCSSYDAVVTLRVPAEKFAETKDALRRIDENQQLNSEQTSTVDVTDTVEQVAAALKTAEAEQTALQELLTKATSVDDIIKIRAQLAVVKTEIQNLTNQQKNLEKNVSYASLTVTLTEASATSVTTPSVSARFALAWNSFRESLSAVGTLGIYLLVYAILYIPLLAVMGVILALIVRFVHRHRK